MTRKQALGRGLSALLPGPREAPRVTGAQEIEIGRLVPGRFQPRHGGSEKSLAELADSIRQHGIVQPIVVAPHGEKLEILAGERRWRAASLAGLETVPVIYRDPTNQDRLEIALVENLQGKTSIPDAPKPCKLEGVPEPGSDCKGSAKIGTVANAIRLLKLRLGGKVRDGSHSRDARALAALVSADDQRSRRRDFRRACRSGEKAFPSAPRKVRGSPRIPSRGTPRKS